MQITIAENRRGSATLVVRHVRDSSVVVFERADVDSLRDLLERFRDLKVSAVPTSTLYLHPDTLQIWTTTLAGESSFSLTLPPSHPTAHWGEQDLSHVRPLLQWCSDLRRAVQGDAGWRLMRIDSSEECCR